MSAELPADLPPHVKHAITVLSAVSDMVVATVESLTDAPTQQAQLLAGVSSRLLKESERRMPT